MLHFDTAIVMKEPTKNTEEAVKIPHALVAYAMGLKKSLVYNVRQGYRKDHHGILPFVEQLQASLDQMRKANIAKREAAKAPVAMQVQDAEAAPSQQITQPQTA